MSAGRSTIPRARTAPGGSGEETMSLINQMLQDLDARRAAHGVGTRLPNDVRPLPKATASHWPLGIALGVGLVFALGVGFVLRDDVARYFARELPSDPVVQTPVALPQAAAPPAATTSTAGDTPELPLAPAEVGANKSVAGLGDSLRMADFIDVPAAPADKVTAQPGPAVPPVAEKAVAREKKVAVSSAATAQASAPAIGTSAAIRPAQEAVAAAEARSDDTGSKAVGKKVEPSPLIERTPAAGSPREQAESEYRKAIAAVNQGRVTEATESLRAALRQDAFHVAARQLLVKLQLEAKDPEEAIQVLREGLGGQPTQIGWAMSLARLQVDRGELDGAWRTLEHSLPAAGNSPDYLGFAANVLQRLGRHDEAAGQYRKAARLAPADGRWWLGLGWSLDAEGNAAEAREAFQRARQSGNLSPELITLIDQKLR